MTATEKKTEKKAAMAGKPEPENKEKAVVVGMTQAVVEGCRLEADLTEPHDIVIVASVIRAAPCRFLPGLPDNYHICSFLKEKNTMRDLKFEELTYESRRRVMKEDAAIRHNVDCLIKRDRRRRKAETLARKKGGE